MFILCKLCLVFFLNIIPTTYAFIIIIARVRPGHICVQCDDSDDVGLNFIILLLLMCRCRCMFIGRPRRWWLRDDAEVVLRLSFWRRRPDPLACATARSDASATPTCRTSVSARCP